MPARRRWSPVTAGRLLDDLETRPAVVAHVDDAHAQVELHRHGERVETAAEVGDRTGNDYVTDHRGVLSCQK